MYRTLFFTSLLLLLSMSCYAQGETNIWYFGNKAGLDFNSGSPVALTDGEMNTGEGCATISDAKGQLLFYTDGISVWNKNHQIMPNGKGLLGDFSSTQSAIIVPKPTSASIYYVFTTAAVGDGGACYSEIDMTLYNGLGDVTSKKNILLVSPVCEKLTATVNGNEDGYWVVTHGNNNNSFFAFSITNQGVNQTPVISNIGEIYPPTGYLKFSPDGKKLVNCGSVNAIELCDFDLSSGIVKNPLKLFKESDSGGYYGAEFSPSGNVLYLSRGSKLLQFDLSSTNIANSQTEIGKSGFAGHGIQLGPNGKIYLAFPGKHLSVINKPDIVGSGCDLDLSGISLDPGTCAVGFPQFTQAFFNFIINPENSCLGNPTAFSLSGNRSITSALWDFGDGTTSNEINPSHQYSNSGNYTVTVTASSNTNKTVTQSKTVVVSEIPVIDNEVPDQSVCFSEDSPAGLSQFNNLILGSQSADDFNITYHLSQNEANLNQNAITNISVFANIESQTVYVRIENKLSPICFTTTNFKLIVKQKPVLAMKDIYSICEGESVTISAPSGFSSYQWSNGTTSSETIINKVGNYSLTVSNGEISCEATKSFMVYNSNAATITKIDIKDWTDSENSIAVEVSGDGVYEYSIDGINYQDSPVFTDLPSGSYIVYVNDKKGCGVVTAEVYLLMYPKYFTPNGDGTHDVWKIKFSSFEPQLKVFIYDRYGKLLKQLIGNDDSWDGRYNGYETPSSDYWFVVKRQNGKEYRGHFSLKR